MNTEGDPNHNGRISPLLFSQRQISCAKWNTSLTNIIKWLLSPLLLLNTSSTIISGYRGHPSVSHSLLFPFYLSLCTHYCNGCSRLQQAFPCAPNESDSTYPLECFSAEQRIFECALLYHFRGKQHLEFSFSKCLQMTLWKPHFELRVNFMSPFICVHLSGWRRLSRRNCSMNEHLLLEKGRCMCINKEVSEWWRGEGQ